MFTSLKHILFFNLIVLSVISVYSQNTASDYTSSQLISYGLDAPGRMAVDSNDYIYVLDADKKSIVIYDGSGVYKRQITTDFNPISIAVNKNKQLFVGDEITGNIYLVNTDGIKTLFHSGAKLPNSMVFGFKNILYVTDSEAKEVLGLDVSGNTVLQFSDPNFTFPTGIAFDEKNNRLVVSEHGGIGPETNTYCNQNGGWAVRNYGPNTSIYAFDLNGTLLNQFGCFGMFDGQNHRIQGVSVGPCGNIYAVDPYLARISVYDEYGNFLTHVGQSGYGSGEFNLPIDILFSSDHRLIVSSMDKASLDVFEITMPTPSAQFKSADITTCSASAELEVQFTGTAPWTFTYSVDGLNPTQITTSDNPYMLTASAGFYEITALTDGNLNTATCFNGGAMVTSSMQPTATVSNTTFDKCTDDGSGIDITFTGIPPYKFTYTINDKNPIEVTTTKQVYTLIPKTSGLYKITFMSNDACSGIVNNGIVDVVVNPLPTAEITNGNGRITIPEGGSTELTIAFTGTEPWTFVYEIDEKNPVTITTDQNPYMLTASLEGTYEVVQITDVNCSSNISKGYPEVVFGTISEPAVATMETSTINICEGNTAVIPIHFTGTSPWTFSYTIDGPPAGEITTSETTYQLMTSTPGVYQLSSVIDGLSNPGIFSGSAVVIENPLPMIDLATSYILCEGDSVVLNPGSFESYLWNDNSTNETLTVYSSGLYSVMVTDINGCTNTATVEVIVNPLPVLNLGPDIEICEGDSVALNPGNFESYLWNNGSTNQTLTVSSSGLYSVMVTDENGCTNTASVEVIVNPLPVLELGTDIVICEGDSASILDAGLFDSYLWSDGSTGRTLEISTPGIYGVTVTNASGCSTSDFVSVSISTLPDAYFYVNINALEVQFVNNSLNTDFHHWDFGDGTSSTEENPIHNYASKGTYTVTYTALSNYCGSSVFTETVNVGGKSTSEIIDIYPNPSTGSFTILISPNEPLLGTINILINSTSGQYLYSGTYNPNMVTSYNGNYYIDVNIAQFTKGIYIVYIDAGNFVGQDKLVLKD